MTELLIASPEGWGLHSPAQVSNAGARPATSGYTVYRMVVDHLFTLVETGAVAAANDRIDTSIASLHSLKHELRKPIPVSIEMVGDDEYIASFENANIAMSGDSPAESLKLLRSHLAAVFDVLTREKDNLGPGPKRQLAILEKYIGQKRRQ